MAKKKATHSVLRASTNEPMIEKIAGKLGHITGEVIVAKNNLVNMAGGAIDSVRSTIQKITTKKPAAKKAERSSLRVKKAVKATVKKVVKKVATAKKSAPERSSLRAKKTVKKAVKKVMAKK